MVISAKDAEISKQAHSKTSFLFLPFPQGQAVLQEFSFYLWVEYGENLFVLLLTAWVQEELTSAQLLVLGSSVCAAGSFVSQCEWSYFWAGGCSQHSYLGACSGEQLWSCFSALWNSEKSQKSQKSEIPTLGTGAQGGTERKPQGSGSFAGGSEAERKNADTPEKLLLNE